ncbi:hypothetical protein Tco_0805335 [Tanacetum coccineum]
MHHSMCSSTSNLVFMTLVLSLWAIPPVVPLIPTFIAINLLTCPRASLVVSSIVICRSPTVTDQMAHYVAPVAFGSTWTIMMIVAFRTQRLGPAVIFLLPVPCSVIFASILPLVRLLLVLIVLGSVIQLPLVLSLAFGKSADLFVYIFLKLHYWTLLWKTVLDFHTYNRCVAANSVRLALSRWLIVELVLNRHPYCMGFGLKKQDGYGGRGTVGGRLERDAHLLLRPYSNIIIHRCEASNQIEVILHCHSELSSESSLEFFMAQNYINRV